MNTSPFETIGSNELDAIATMSVVSTGQHGGPMFNLEDGMVVPFIPPKDMGLSSPMGGERDLFTFIKHADVETKAIMTYNIALLNQAETSTF